MNRCAKPSPGKWSTRISPFLSIGAQHYRDLVEGGLGIGDISVSARYLNHPALTLGYGLQVDGATLVYACDHEPYSRALGLGEGRIAGEDLQHAEFMRGADLLIHDARYTAQEYPTKMGWGHSPVEYVVKLAEQALVKRVALTHHDPGRDDDAIDRLIASTYATILVDPEQYLRVREADTPTSFAPRTQAFVQGLRDLYVEGRTVAIEWKWGQDRDDLLPDLAAELVGSQVDVIVTEGTPPAKTLKNATRTIPIVMAIVGDPAAPASSIVLPGPAGMPPGLAPLQLT